MDTESAVAQNEFFQWVDSPADHAFDNISGNESDDEKSGLINHDSTTIPRLARTPAPITPSVRGYKGQIEKLKKDELDLAAAEWSAHRRNVIDLRSHYEGRINDLRGQQASIEEEKELLLRERNELKDHVSSVVDKCNKNEAILKQQAEEELMEERQLRMSLERRLAEQQAEISALGSKYERLNGEFEDLKHKAKVWKKSSHSRRDRSVNGNFLSSMRPDDLAENPKYSYSGSRMTSKSSCDDREGRLSLESTIQRLTNRIEKLEMKERRHQKCLQLVHQLTLENESSQKSYSSSSASQANKVLDENRLLRSLKDQRDNAEERLAHEKRNRRDAEVLTTFLQTDFINMFTEKFHEEMLKNRERRRGKQRKKPDLSGITEES